MKIKPAMDSRGVVVELGRGERAMPSGAEMAPSFSLKQILVPIDFSPCSKKALQYALPLARQFGARLCLLHVTQNYYLAPELAPLDMTGMEAKALSDASQKLDEIAMDAGGDVSIETMARNGHTPTEIANVAKEIGADVIVMSTHGYTGLKHAWFGSTTEGVVRHAPCPVLVVREEEHEFIAAPETPEDSVSSAGFRNATVSFR